MFKSVNKHILIFEYLETVILSVSAAAKKCTVILVFDEILWKISVFNNHDQYHIGDLRARNFRWQSVGKR